MVWWLLSGLVLSWIASADPVDRVWSDVSSFVF